jgi:hypothetical protein
MSDIQNPYAAPKANIEHAEAGGEAEMIRKQHINMEASIQAVGRLYLLGCFLALLGFVSILIVMVLGRGDGVAGAIGFLPSALGMLCIGALYGTTGFGLRKLKTWARIVATIVSVIGLIGFPIGTLISGYILYLLWSKKGRTVFTSDYQDVIAATPHIKYKTSILVWIILGIIVLAVAATVVLPLIRGA